MKHANLATAAAIALRARRFGDFSSLCSLGRQHGLRMPEVRLDNAKERDFEVLLKGVLDGITTVRRQVQTGRYRVDFVLPELQLAVEYDELHHLAPSRVRADEVRQREIVQQSGLLFLRVGEGQEVSGLNQILRRLVSLQRDRRFVAAAKKDATVGSR
jgi:very-short-patch-repair endonuclease